MIPAASSEISVESDRQLREIKLALRGMGPYGLVDCLRATICEQNIMDRCLKVLKEVLQ